MEVLHMGILQLIEQDMNFAFHWKCADLRLFQLGFADDLLLFCRANTESVRVFKSGLDRFADWVSGRPLTDEVFGSTIDLFSINYRPLPTITEQIIKSVLVALGVYWASAFILPKGVIKNIEKRLRVFLWRGMGNSGYPKVAWKEICKPKEEGGLGLKDMSTLNRALMCKKLCEVIRCDRTSIWVEWLRHDRLRDDSIWTIPENRGPWGWRKILRLRGWLRSVVEYRISNGNEFLLWKDPWHHLGPLFDRFPRGPNSLGLHESTKLSSVIYEGHWHWPLITDMEYVEITHVQKLTVLHGFEHEERPPSVVANLIVDDVRQRILSIKLPSSISTCALYRLWRIPWPVEGSA
ncbi:UNVERIFIED_CONTAM: hypothetical protein Sindi_2318600 [Sesamum indicum]